MKKEKTTKIKEDLHRELSTVVRETGLKFHVAHDKALRAGLKIKFGKIITRCNQLHTPPAE